MKLIFNLQLCVLLLNILYNSADANVCTGQPTGTKLPHPTDCNRFILCDNGASMNLICRSTEPHFDRCTGRCVNNLSVCGQTSCTQPTTGTTTQSSTQSPITSTTTKASTTTQFIPPTVPKACPTPCVGTDSSCTGGCKEQFTCMNGKCGCDSKILCPFAITDCEKNCGCPENCKETATGSGLYLCAPILEQCPFEDKDGACVKNCGCSANCKCDIAATDTDTAKDCKCEDPCKCIGPPDLCPFLKSQCVAKCNCDERCLCRGPTCTCDSTKQCPKIQFYR